jgi:hypothetical protein
VPSETTLTYHPALGAWVALRVNTFLGPNVTLLYAAEVTGPWAALDVYTIPPGMLAGGVFCYAGKVHSELTPGASTRELILSFMCNTPTIAELLDRPDIYVPQLVRVVFP